MSFRVDQSRRRGRLWVPFGYGLTNLGSRDLFPGLREAYEMAGQLSAMQKIIRDTHAPLSPLDNTLRAMLTAHYETHFSRIACERT